MSSTSLYTSPGNAGNVASKNYTTLYSGSGSIHPTQPYGNANVVGLLAESTDGANTIGIISATGNIITDGYFIGDGGLLSNISGANVSGNVLNAQFVTNSAQANITSVGVLTSLSAAGNITAPYFLGNVVGNITGNVVVNGANTQVLINQNGNIGVGAGFTFNTASNVLSVPGTMVANNVNANTVFHNGTGVAIQSNAWSQLQYTNSISAPADQTTIGTGSWFYVDASGAAFESNVTGTLKTVVLGNDGSVSAQGNVTGNYLFGNGSQITGLPVQYGNADVSAYLASGTNPANIITTANVIAATLKTSGVSGNIVGADYVSANFYLGDGGLLSNVSSYGNANVTSLLSAFGSNTISTTGNVTASYFIGNVIGNIVGNVVVPGSNTQVLINDNGNIGTGAGFTFNTSGNVLSVPGSVTAVGNVTGNYILGNGSQLTGLPATYGNADVVSLLASFGSNSISTTGNVTASYVIGNGSLLSSITGANVTGVVANATFATSSGSATTAVTVTGNAQANITSVGTLTSLSVTGNVDAGNVQTTGLISATGNIRSANNLLLGGGISAAGNVFSNTALRTAGVISATGTVTAGNVVTGGLVSVTGNTTTGGILTDNYYYANGTPVSFAGTYSNANVVNLMAAFGSNSISTSGNVSAGNVLIGDLLGAGNVTATGNVTGAFIVGNGSLLSNITGANVTGTVANAASATTASTVTGNAQANITSVGILSSLSVSGNTTTGGLLTDNYYYANGTPVSFAGTYANANVADFMANFGSNSISTTGNVTAGYFTGNGSLLTAITGANVTGVVANATYATSSGSATTAVTVTGNAQANITSVGTLTSLSVTGNVTAGNVIAPNFQAVNSAGGTLKNSAGTTQAAWGAGGGDNFTLSVSTNITGANAQIDISPTGNSGHVHIKPTGTPSVEIAPTYTGSINNMVIGNITPAAVSATTVSATGNVTGNYFIGNGSLLSSITGANVTGTVANATYATSSGSATTAVTVTGNAQANITSVGTLTSLSVTGNVDSGNVRTAGIISATGNATAGNVLSSGLVSAVGNVQGGNLIIGSDVQLSGHIQSAKTWDTTVVSGTVPNPGRITIGTGYDSLGNFSPNYDLFTQGRNAYVYEMNKSNIATAGLRTQNFTSTLFANVNANINSSSNGATRFATNINALVIGGGTSGGNLVQTNPQGMTASIHNLAVGGIGTYSDIGVYNAGNQWFNGLLAAVNVNSGSNIGIGVGAQTTNNITVNGAANTLIGFAAISTISNAGKLNIGVYIPTESGSTLPTDMPTGTGQYQATSNQVTGNTASGFTADYYGIRIDSNLAKQKLGSINTFHQTNLATSASGNITINKNNGQFQTLNITADTTIDGFANVVTTANTTVQTTVSYQSDTITLVIRQSSTGNTVTMPTGAAYKYTSGSSTITSTANAVQLVTAIAVYNTTTAANEYLIDISPVYS
jgi:hypothetical protein